MFEHSFEFNGNDMYQLYGLRVRKRHETLTPPLRERKVIIPTRNGAYDYGARWYDERTLLVECDTITQLTKSQRREMAQRLSKKGTIKFWDEDDKYYIGRIYDSAEIERIGGIGTYLPLTFICDPFLYGSDISRTFSGVTYVTLNNPDYSGTADTPIKVTFRNNYDSPVDQITIQITKRRN